MNDSMFQLRDLLILPIILLVIYRTSYHVRVKYYKNSEIGKFLLPGITIKVIFTILLALMVEFVYGYGDLWTYYKHALMLNNILIERPEFMLDLIFKAYTDLPIEVQVLFPNDYLYRFSDSTAWIPRIALPFTFLSFGSYWGAGFVFSSFAFIGSWKLFRMFYELFPHLKKQFAIAILFFPSVGFWCSGILKDSLGFGGITLFVYAIYMVFIKREKIFFYAIIAIFSITIVTIVKGYIIFSALPCAFIWIFLEVKSVVKKRQRKIFYAVSFLTLPIIFGVCFFLIQGSFAANAYISDEVLTDIQMIQELYEGIEGQGSFVSIGKFDGTLSSLGLMAPASIFIVLFRPFIWESSSFIMLLSALESMVLTYLTLMVFWKYKFNLMAIIREIRKKPILIFCILFSLVFAVVVGISTSNFGTMSRYRVHGIPFYLITLFLLLDARKRKLLEVEQI